MTDDLWQIFLRLQSAYSYGEGMCNLSLEPAWPHALQTLHERNVTPTRILIVGPGASTEPGEFRTAFPNAEIVLITINEEEAERLQTLGYNASVADIHALPCERGYFNFIFAADVLEHTLAPYVALMQLRRVLSPLGLAYFAMPWFDGENGGRGPFHLHCVDDPVWVELMRKTGFRELAMQRHASERFAPHGQTHYLVEPTTPSFPHNLLLRELEESWP